MKRTVILLIAATFLAIFVMACDMSACELSSCSFNPIPQPTEEPPWPPPTEEPAQPLPTEEPAQPLPTEEPLPPPPVGGDCDSRSMQIDANSSYNEDMHSTTEPYPANCLYYCLWIQDGQNDLTIGIYDFNEDLDLYVGMDSMDAVLGSDPNFSTWKSNDFGLVDEEIDVSNPEGGVYYIEVCSYESLATPFRISTQLD